MVPLHQFGFRQNRSTNQQNHNIINVINQALEQLVFEKVWWHAGFPITFHSQLKSYLSRWKFKTKINGEVAVKKTKFIECFSEPES